MVDTKLIRDSYTAQVSSAKTAEKNYNEFKKNNANTRRIAYITIIISALGILGSLCLTVYLNQQTENRLNKELDRNHADGIIKNMEYIAEGVCKADENSSDCLELKGVIVDLIDFYNRGDYINIIGKPKSTAEYASAMVVSAPPEGCIWIEYKERLFCDNSGGVKIRIIEGNTSVNESDYKVVNDSDYRKAIAAAY